MTKSTRRRSAVGATGLVCLFTSLAQGRPHRVAQVPNGSVNSCLTCHTFAVGGVRNVFGHTIEANFLTAAGDVTWNATLANLDSDADGRSNGSELLDPTGVWTIGAADPGTPGAVTNPGVPTPRVPALGGAAGLLGFVLAMVGVRVGLSRSTSFHVAE